MNTSLLTILLLSLCALAWSQMLVGGIGDDISTGLNSNNYDITVDEGELDFPVSALDPSCGRSNPARSWGSMIDNTFESIFSYAEQSRAAGANLVAEDGATMLNGFHDQAVSLATFLKKGREPRAIILIGHGDMCTSETQKSAGSCSNPDQDPQNYCRTTGQAFEREFRRGLDELVVVNNSEIIVFAPLRYSQICNFAQIGHTSESLYGPSRDCQTFWKETTTASGFGPCSSLTTDCSTSRIEDAYNTQLGYFKILESVIQQYNALSGGSKTPSAVGHSGGAVVAAGVTVTFRSDLWNYRFQIEDVSSCDCLHPTKLMQQKIANITSNTLQCPGSSSIRCCGDESPAVCGGDPTLSAASASPLGITLALLVLLATLLQF